MNIVPNDKPGTQMRAVIVRLSPQMVRDKIGFDSNIDEDEDDYGASWAFEVDGVHCGVWYRRMGSSPHASGTKEALEKVFGANNVQWFG